MPRKAGVSLFQPGWPGPLRAPDISTEGVLPTCNPPRAGGAANGVEPPQVASEALAPGEKVVRYNAVEHTIVLYKKRAKKEIGKGKLECPKCQHHNWAANGECANTECLVDLKQAREEKRLQERTMKLHLVQAKGSKLVVNASHHLHRLRSRLDNIYASSSGAIQVAAFCAAGNPKMGGKLNYSIFGAGPAAELYTTFTEMENGFQNTCKMLQGQKEARVGIMIEQLLKATDCSQHLGKCKDITPQIIFATDTNLLVKDVGFTLPEVWRMKTLLTTMTEEASKLQMKEALVDFALGFDPELEAPADPTLPGC